MSSVSYCDLVSITKPALEQMSCVALDTMVMDNAEGKNPPWTERMQGYSVSLLI